jgi:uncharacterized protein (TIGR03437 family)
VNSANNPAPVGSIVSPFGTGASWPAGLRDGTTAASAMPLSQEQNQFEPLDWTETPLNVLHAGAAPGTIDGVFQINVQLQPIEPLPALAGPALTLQSTPQEVPLSSNAVLVYIQ